MKKLLLLLLTLLVLIGLSSCEGDGKNVINVWSFTDEVPNALMRFKEMNPDFPYDFNVTIIATTEGAYQPALDQALVAGGKRAPDIFTAEAAFVLKYTQGELSNRAMPYKNLGIDVDNQLRAAQIATYVHEIGTRPSDNQVVGLAFQNTGSGLIYRRSIARDVFGTDDPARISSIVGPGWDKYLSAAAQLKAKGYSIASGEGDIWQVIRNTATQSYVVNGKLYLDPAREAFLDVAKAMFDNDYTNRTGAWSDAWFADMAGTGARPVFGFLGPAWLINYVMINNVQGTFGDWAVAVPPVPFSWGGTWIIANQQGNASVRDGVKTVLEWLTLDSSNTGFQYMFANGNLYEGSAAFPDKAKDFADGKFAKDAVASGTVMSRSDGTLAILGGQNMYDVFIPAGANAKGDFFSAYDETISQLFNDQVQLYINGTKTREQAIADWRQNVVDILDIQQ
ncbi:MAG: carbohydrate ABC transporter substrate-binding protein [Treponema sp.]|nr:carbohydrate ABC transporter substrate-binding protein [Treponema sp.]